MMWRAGHAHTAASSQLSAAWLFASFGTPPQRFGTDHPLADLKSAQLDQEHGIMEFQNFEMRFGKIE